MKLVITLLALVTTSVAFAGPNIKPANTSSPVCLQRVYSKEHLKANPKQKLSELTIQVSTENMSYVDENNNDVNYDFTLAKVIGRNVADGKLYGNTAGCEFKADGSAFCSIECDGGSFSLKQRPDWINFVVTKDYYFPLFLGVLEPDIENTPPELAFDGNDVDNNTFRVEKVSNDRCEEAIEQVEAVEGGC